tara:strand:- start:46 stop:453 length:408 start_codon:yes stop_codon:yes gene_type:complete
LKKRISKKDKKDWLNFVNSKDRLIDKDDSKKIVNKKFKKKIIDLHGYSLEEANNLISNFILICFKEKVSKIVVITGKGSRSKNINDPYKSKDLSILKYSVPNYIKSNIDLMKIIKEIDFNQVNDNSSGSFNIILR